jgi:hypothetical protein
LLAIPPKAKIVTLIGNLALRKNPIEAYKRIEDLRKYRNENVYLVFAGVHTEKFKVALSSVEELRDVLQIDRFLSDAELKGLLRRSNLIFLPYKNRGASGIALNSLVLGTSVFLYGSHNWKRLQGLLGGKILIGNKNSRKLVQQLNQMIDLPKTTPLSFLLDENIPSLSEFLLQDFK